MGPFLFVTDLHGNRRKYERTLELALELKAWLVVNGGDMFPHGRMHGDQERFLREFLDPHFGRYQDAGIRHLGFPANDDLRVHDPLFEEICSRYPRVENPAGRKVPARITSYNVCYTKLLRRARSFSRNGKSVTRLNPMKS